MKARHFFDSLWFWTNAYGLQRFPLFLRRRQASQAYFRCMFACAWCRMWRNKMVNAAPPLPGVAFICVHPFLSNWSTGGHAVEWWIHRRHLSRKRGEGWRFPRHLGFSLKILMKWRDAAIRYAQHMQISNLSKSMHVLLQNMTAH